MFLLGINLRDDKLVRIALTAIYGVGRPTAEKLCHRLAIHPQCRLKDLPEAKVTALAHALNGMTIESELRRQTHARIKTLIEIGSYRGARHAAGFPVKGQRTHSNASTAHMLNAARVRSLS